MKKRGQASVFVIIGIVIIVVFALIFFFRESLSKSIRETPTNQQEYLTQQLGDIRNEIRNCVVSETSESVKLLMENGGSFNREFNYLTYFNKKYPILCKEFADRDGCISEPIFVSNLQEKLNQRLPQQILNCVDFSAFEGKDYELDQGEVLVDAVISDEDILVRLDFPIELKKDVYSVEEDDFVYNLDVPLGELTGVVNQLVQKKASGGEIDALSYSIINRNKYLIDVNKPYPDELYEVRLSTNEDYVYYFAIEGVGRFERSLVVR